MMLLVTYDVNTETLHGRKRLRHVAKICTNYGQRVQNSVFECIVTPAQVIELESLLEEAIDENLDSLRFYDMGSSYLSKIRHIGAKETMNLDGTLIF